MYERKIPLSLECGVHLFQEVIKGKWKVELIYRIASGIRRPGELQRKIPRATRRVLDAQLGELILHGIIRKDIAEGTLLKTEYYLTTLGESLTPLIYAMAEWGEQHREELDKRISNS